MNELLRRVEVLEKKAPKADEAFLVVFRPLVAPGAPIREPVAFRAYSGAVEWRIDRLPGEGVDDFRLRATAQVPKNARGFAALVELYE